MEQLKYLEVVNAENDEFKFIDDGKISYEEKQELLELDESYYDMYGKHIIINYKDLKY